MPWANYAEAKRAAPGLVSVRPNAQSKPQPVKNKAALDALAAIYDAVKARGGMDNPAAVAKTTFVKGWRHKGNRVWAKRETVSKALGRQPGGAALGPGGNCVCPDCGATAPHETGTPCYDRDCPECGAKMTRAGMSKEVAVSEVQVPFASYATLVKAYTEAGKRYVVYACADDGPDLQKGEVRGQRTIADVIDLAFLEKMATENVAKALPLVATHEDPFQVECPLGKAVESWIEPAGASPFGKPLAHNTLLTKFELTDGDPRAEVLWKQGEAGGDGRGTSVHGGISRVAVELAKNAGGFVRRILDGYLDHHAVLVPGRAANPRMGMVAAMSKALQESDAEITTPDADVLVEDEDADYKNAASSDFSKALVAIRTQRGVPRLNDLLKSVIDRIMWADEDEVPNKRAAMIAAVNAHDAEVKRLVSEGDLSKSQADELTDEAAALVEAAENETAAGDDPAAEAGGEAAKEETPMAETQETLDKALDPKAVAASLRHAAKVFNGMVKLMGGDEADGVPDVEEAPEDLGKALTDFDAGVSRVALLSKGFAAVVSLDAASKAKADAAVRANEVGETPVKGALGMAPGAMSKEQIDEFAEALKAQGYVLAKAEATPPPAQPEPVADEIERVVGLLADQDLVKAVVAKLPGATREALNKSLAPQAAQPTGEPLVATSELGESNRSDADYYADFLRRRPAAQ